MYAKIEMKIDEMKNTIIALLKARFDVEEKTELYLSDSALVENGLVGDTFWNVVCPSLKKIEFLKEYDDPNWPFSQFQQKVIEDHEYSALLGPVIHLTKEKMDRIEPQLKEIEVRIRKHYMHKFVIDSKILSEMTVKQPEELAFDKDKSILYFGGEKIKIAKNVQSDAHDLLATLFSEKDRLWNNDEILEAWKFDLTKSKIPKNKVYHAGKAVNRIVAEHTTKQDFLEVTTKTVRINPAYSGSL